MTPGQRKERARLESICWLRYGLTRKLTRKEAVNKGSCVRPVDNFWRHDPCGRARAHYGTADDLTTAVPDDSLADHLIIASDPSSYAVGFGSLADWISNGYDEDADEAVEDDADTVFETVALPSGVCYSTASTKHLVNLAQKDAP